MAKGVNQKIVALARRRLIRWLRNRGLADVHLFSNVRLLQTFLGHKDTPPNLRDALSKSRSLKSKLRFISEAMDLEGRAHPISNSAQYRAESEKFFGRVIGASFVIEFLNTTVAAARVAARRPQMGRACM
jgi:hypothetical protein